MQSPETPAKPRPIWLRPKVIVVVLAAIVLLIIIFQNLQPVQTKILFLDMQMPQAFLLAIVAAIAFFVGVVSDGRMFRRAKGKPQGR